MGLDVFNGIDPESPVIVAVGIWQFSQNILSGLRNHRGPILTIGNWSGKFPGLVGLLNLNASMVKAGIPYSTIWSETFNDDFFKRGIHEWLASGKINHEIRYPHSIEEYSLPVNDVEMGKELAERLLFDKPIIGVFDEGCMGMYNAIIDDEYLNAIGIYKERLSQSGLLAEMKLVRDDEARAVRSWLESRGMKFMTGPDEATDLTDSQILEQCKMYIAAVRIANYYSCESIGIQYSSGLKDMAPASDLAEGLMNNPDRPPVYGLNSSRLLYPDNPLPNFNEADEGAAIDMVVNKRVWDELGLDPSMTLHDVRWGAHYRNAEIDDFVWVFLISGAVPASHFARGYAEAVSVRQPPTSFKQGGGTLRGISKPGEIIWSRAYIKEHRLCVDMGRGRSVKLPTDEVERRWNGTTSQWPMMNAILYGVTRDQFMARHCSNHISVTYAPTPELADKAFA
ncbi:MAG: fucose isomerase, partial [Spirochaetes bacterium]|nr:fucose isomerase [Spirochaetota bacterium]